MGSVSGWVRTQTGGGSGQGTGEEAWEQIGAAREKVREERPSAAS